MVVDIVGVVPYMSKVLVVVVVVELRGTSSESRMHVYVDGYVYIHNIHIDTVSIVTHGGTAF